MTTTLGEVQGQPRTIATEIRTRLSQRPLEWFIVWCEGENEAKAVAQLLTTEETTCVIFLWPTSPGASCG